MPPLPPRFRRLCTVASLINYYICCTQFLQLHPISLGVQLCIHHIQSVSGNRWSLVTIRLALAVFVQSPAAYDALQGFGLWQLPSRFTLQAYAGAFLDAGTISLSLSLSLSSVILDSLALSSGTSET